MVAWGDPARCHGHHPVVSAGPRIVPGMPSRPLDPDTMLAIELSTICSRNKYTDDTDAVLAELRATAGDRTDILAAEVGEWIGFYGEDAYVEKLAAALATMTDLDLAPHIALGRQRRDTPTHSTRGFTREPGA